MSDEPHQYNLRWRNHRKNFFDELENLFKTDLLTDINLILEGGRVVPCHKMVLATTSLAFRDFLLKNPEALDMIIPGVTYDQMRTLLEYMYSGQAQIMYSELSSLLKVAEQLKIKGPYDRFRERRLKLALEQRSGTCHSCAGGIGQLASPHDRHQHQRPHGQHTGREQLGLAPSIRPLHRKHLRLL